MMTIHSHQNAPQGACVAGPKNRSALDPTVVVNFLKLGLETDSVPESIRANHTMYTGGTAHTHRGRR